MNASHFELRFRSLFQGGRALSFASNEQGAVQLDDLSEQARENYFFARTVVGRDYATPVVCAADEMPAVLHS